MTVRRRNALLALVLFLAGPWLCGCRQESQTSFSFLYIDTTGGMKMKVNGIDLEIDSAFPFHYSRTEGIGFSGDGEEDDSMTINDQDFGFDGEEFFIGSRRYGTARAGDLIRVSPDGVFVNDERRGDPPL